MFIRLQEDVYAHGVLQAASLFTQNMLNIAKTTKGNWVLFEAGLEFLENKYCDV